MYHIKHILHIQEYDKWTCEPHPSCHHCFAGIPEFLRTDLPSAPKSMNKRQEEIEHEASGDGLREQGTRNVVEGSVVEWDEDDANVRAGPNKRFYESSREECGAHMTYTAFWEVPNFCPIDAAARRNACYWPWGHHSPDIGNTQKILYVCWTNSKCGGVSC